MTPADIQFVRAFFQARGDALQAFRMAYDPESDIPEPEVVTQVAALMQREDIIAEVRSANRRFVLHELEAARQKAMQEPGGAQAAVAASAVKAQLLGLIPALANQALVHPPAQSTPEASGETPNGKASEGGEPADGSPVRH